MKLGIFNMDEYRHAIERMEPRHYLSASYYERSLTSLATLCVEKGILTQEELERRAQGAFPLSTAERAGPQQRRHARGASSRATRSRVTHRLRPGHVRMPGYIRGKTGVVVGVSPAYPFPDAHAHGIKAEDEPTYDVRFNAEELWPNSADPAFVHVGVFQSYLWSGSVSPGRRLGRLMRARTPGPHHGSRPRGPRPKMRGRLEAERLRRA